MKTILVSALLLTASAIAALPSAAAIVCTYGAEPDVCVGVGTGGCTVWYSNGGDERCVNPPPVPDPSELTDLRVEIVDCGGEGWAIHVHNGGQTTQTACFHDLP